jgi:hypothetical protein
LRRRRLLNRLGPKTQILSWGGGGGIFRHGGLGHGGLGHGAWGMGPGAWGLGPVACGLWPVAGTPPHYARGRGGVTLCWVLCNERRGCPFVVRAAAGGEDNPFAGLSAMRGGVHSTEPAKREETPLLGALPGEEGFIPLNLQRDTQICGISY